MSLKNLHSLRCMLSFLQTTEWVDFQKSLGRRVFEYNQDNISARVIKHQLPFGRSYLYIPHGPEIDLNVMTGGLKNPVSNFLNWLKALAQKEGAVFVKAEPPADNIAQILVERGFKKSKREVQPARTVVIDLGKSEEELLSAMHHKTRYNIKIAEKHGVAVEEDDNIDVFWELMEKTTARGKFSSHPREYYQKLLERLREGALCAKLFVARGGGRPAAAALVLFYGDSGYYLHGASNYDLRALMAPYKLHWEIIEKLQVSGYGFYDLWGIDANRWPGVTRFKLGWGGRVVEHPGAFDLTISKFWHLMYKTVK